MTRGVAAGIILISTCKYNVSFPWQQLGLKFITCVAVKMEAVARASEWKGWRNACASLREWRGTGEKRNDLVLQLGAKLLKDHSSRLGAEGRFLPIHVYLL